MLSTFGAAALHDGQLFPKKNSTTTLLLKPERLTSEPSRDLSVKPGASEPGSRGSVLPSFVHDEKNNANTSKTTLDLVVSINALIE